MAFEQEWPVPPDLVTLQIGTMRCETAEDDQALHAALADLTRAGLVREVIRRLRVDGRAAVCPDALAAAAALRRIEALGLDLDLPAPRPGHRESIAEPIVQRERYVRQFGGPGRFAIIELRVAPLADRGLVRFGCAPGLPGALSAPFIRAVAAGVRRAVFAGGPRGHPLAGLDVTLSAGLEHPVDSNERSFAIAGQLAVERALEAAGVEMPA